MPVPSLSTQYPSLPHPHHTIMSSLRSHPYPLTPLPFHNLRPSLPASPNLRPSLPLFPKPKPLPNPNPNPNPNRRPGLPPILAVSTGHYPPIPFAPPTTSDSDDIGAFNDRLRQDHRQRFSSSSSSDGGGGSVDSSDTGEYLKAVRDQQRRGLTMLKGDLPDDGGLGYKVNPYSLEPGDHVVHKKYGIGQFEYIGVSSSRNGEPEDYVFIKYADGMAKLSVRKARKSLYRYSHNP